MYDQMIEFSHPQHLSETHYREFMKHSCLNHHRSPHLATVTYLISQECIFFGKHLQSQIGKTQITTKQSGSWNPDEFHHSYVPKTPFLNNI